MTCVNLANQNIILVNSLSSTYVQAENQEESMCHGFIHMRTMNILLMHALQYYQYIGYWYIKSRPHFNQGLVFPH